MADYREHYREIRSAGASVVAVSVDAPGKAAALRVDLSLPFPILCDTEHRVVRDWGIYNSEEKGGIAKPAVFIIDPSHVVRYAAVDSVVRRVPATEIVSLLQMPPKGSRFDAGSTSHYFPSGKARFGIAFRGVLIKGRTQAYQRGRTRFQSGSTRLRISASSSRLR